MVRHVLQDLVRIGRSTGLKVSCCMCDTSTLRAYALLEHHASANHHGPMHRACFMISTLCEDMVQDHELVRSIKLDSQPFTVERGLLTATQKKKRAAFVKHYAPVLPTLLVEAGGQQPVKRIPSAA